MEVGEHRPESREVRAVQPVAVDRPDGHDPNADRRGARSDGLEERLALLDRDLLGVVQPCERAHAGTTQRLIVEEHARDDERPGERATARLVRTRDVADAELAVEPEETLAAGPSHAADNTR